MQNISEILTTGLNLGRLIYILKNVVLLKNMQKENHLLSAGAAKAASPYASACGPDIVASGQGIGREKCQ